MDTDSCSCLELCQKQKILEAESLKLDRAVSSINEENILKVRKNVIEFLSKSHFLKDMLVLVESMRV